MPIKIKPLSRKTLKPAIKLLHGVFAYPEGRRETKKGLTISLDPEKYKETYKKEKLKWVKYYVALEGAKVVGTSGLYKMENDPKETFWLGWFCVDETYRRKGIGSKLLDYTIREEKRRSGRTLKLWTTNHPPMLTAQILYRKMGFKIFKKERISGTGYQTIYERLKLK